MHARYGRIGEQPGNESAYHRGAEPAIQIFLVTQELVDSANSGIVFLEPPPLVMEANRSVLLNEPDLSSTDRCDVAGVRNRPAYRGGIVCFYLFERRAWLPPLRDMWPVKPLVQLWKILHPKWPKGNSRGIRSHPCSELGTLTQSRNRFDDFGDMPEYLDLGKYP